MEFKDLIKRRGSFKAKLTQFKAHLSIVQSCDTLSNLQISEINVRLAKIEELYSDFDCTHSDIENACEIPDEQYKERENFESQYFGAIAAARELLSGRDPAAEFGSAAGSSAGHRGGPKLKLPVVHIPTFAGHHHEWLEFRDTFTSLIHTDNSIPKINKFHYLRASLKDSAALIIGSLEFTADNYDNAWELLCDRYNNKRLLVNNHIQAIFDISSLSKESAKALRNIIDTVNRNLRALKTLSLPTDGWDMLIIHTIVHKLDATTSREWETHRNTLGDLPTLSQFNTFLKNRADLLEAIEEGHNHHIPRRHSDVTHNNHHIPRRHSDVIHNRPRTFTLNSHSHSTSNIRSFSCPMCKNNHAIYQCPRFKSIPIETRIEKARSLKLCLNCLRQGHAVATCKSGTCRICNKSHNTLLHLQGSRPYTTQPLDTTTSGQSETAPSLDTSDTAPDSQSQSCLHSHNNVVLSTTHNQCTVLLSTALIHISGPDGLKHTARALLDSGSTASFITESLRSKLKLPITSTNAVVEGLGGHSSSIAKQCHVTVKSRINSYNEDVQCFIVENITHNIPTTRVDDTSLNIPQNITLADPQFHTPSQVDMLLGADLFWSILCSNRISLGRNKPMLSQSQFGWLISGPMHSSSSHIHHTQIQSTTNTLSQT